jgi:two-component system chemotaxis response regulator CheY
MKILLVDDSGTMRKIQKRVLGDMGETDIVEAGDGFEALSALEENPDVGLVLLDWNMPNKDGFETLIEMRKVKSKEEMCIVMVTTEAEKSRIIQAVQAGANNYIVKPFTPETIKEKLGKILAG